MSEETKPQTPPYVGYETFKNAIKKLGEESHLPTRIDGSLFPTMSYSAKAQFLGVLKFFGLVSENGTPEDEFCALASQDEAKWDSTMKALLQKRYKAQLVVLATGSESALKESFGKIGGVVVPASRFLMAAAKDVGLPVSAHIKRITGGEKKQRKSEPARSPFAAFAKPEPSHVETGDAFTDALLNKFPSFDPNWDDAQQDRWFKAYDKLLALKERIVK